MKLEQSGASVEKRLPQLQHWTGRGDSASTRIALSVDAGAELVVDNDVVLCVVVLPGVVVLSVVVVVLFVVVVVL